MTTPEAFERLRPLMFSIAYRMLATVSEAEDIVQEAFLRYHGALSVQTVIESPKAYLSAVTTRLSIDYLRSARVRRESYVGTWLPEPVLTDTSRDDPAHAAEQSESLSMTFLLLLERLSPTERAVFLLRDVFHFGYGDIAGVVDKSEANCRQLALRARRHVTEHQPRFDSSEPKSRQLADTFFAAMTEGDIEGLVAVLAEDAIVYGDSGGHRPSWPRPITGRDNVARLLVALGRQIRSLEIDGGRVQTVRSVINPDKLRHLGPLADRGRLLAALGRGPGGL